MASLRDIAHAQSNSAKSSKAGSKSKSKPKSDAHPGFQAVAGEIAQKEGYSKERASAILASRSRKASPAAKARNPRLKRVKG